MPDTTIRQGDLTPGWTDLYARIENEQGQVWNGTAFVGFVVANIATYRVAMAESPASSGRYSVAFPALPAGTYTWKIFKGSGTLVDLPYGGPSTAYWDGTKFVNPAGGVAAMQATLDSYAAITPAATVTDTAPTTGSFVITLANNAPVPTTFVWRNNEVWFQTGVLFGGKYPIATYSRLTATTARLTFAPLLPAAPANGDTLLLG